MLSNNTSSLSSFTGTWTENEWMKYTEFLKHRLLALKIRTFYHHSDNSGQCIGFADDLERQKTSSTK